MPLKRFSFRFAEQILNNKLALEQEIENMLTDLSIDNQTLSPSGFYDVLDERFVKAGWKSQLSVFDDIGDTYAKIDFVKERIGVELGFGHAAFIGIDFLKFQVASYSGLDNIDMGVYIVTTNKFQTGMTKDHEPVWEWRPSFEQVVRYLPHFKSVIQLPIYVLGIDL